MNQYYQKSKCILIILYYIIALPIIGYTQTQYIEYGNKLSNCSSVRDIIQDHQGYIWIGTDYGLNRLLGSNIKTFVKHQKDSTSIPNNLITALYEDSQNRLWIGTSAGLCIYNAPKERFIKIYHNFYNRVKDMPITDIIEDKEKNIWIIINGELLMQINNADNNVTLIESNELKRLSPRLFYIDKQGRIWLFGKNTRFALFDPKIQKISLLSSYKDIPEKIKNKSFCAICPDKKGNILASTLDGGLYHINTTNFNIDPISNINNSKMGENILSIFRDKKNRIWIGTDGYGVCQYSEETHSLIPYELSNINFNSSTGKIQSIYEDKYGNILFPFVEKGIVILSPDHNNFKSIKHNIYSTKTHFSEHSILSLLADNDNLLWVGTNGGGLYLFKKESDNYCVKKQYLSTEKVITALFKNSDGKIFIGTYMHGFYIYDGKNMKHYLSSSELNSINANHIVSFAEDKNKNIWIATNGGGVSIMNRKGEIIKHLTHRDKINNIKKNTLFYLPNIYCNTLYSDHEKMWIGTSNGITCINTDTWKTLPYIKRLTNLSNINCITINGNKNHVLFGTSEGLYKLSFTSNGANTEKIKNDALDSFIYSIEKDDKNRFWIATNEKIVNYDTKTDKTNSYDSSDGIFCLPFKGRSSTQAKDRTIFWGGNRGITYLNFKKGNRQNSLPKVLLCDLFINNEHIDIDSIYKKNVILKKSLQFTDKIVLNNNQNKITIDYNSAILSSSSFEYEYIMEGVDSYWQSNKKMHSITYTNLKAGKYKFKIRTRNESIQGEITELDIIVKQPWWWSSLAIISYILIISCIIYSIYRFNRIRSEEKRRLIEQNLQEQLAQSKLQFFTDISHEIRTPLTLITSPLQKLLDKETDLSKRNLLQIMNQNANRVIRLINQLLDIRKIEKGQMKLSVNKVNLELFIKDIVQSFSLLAQDKQLSLSYNIDPNLNDIWIDTNFLDKILYNLLSNAFKFTTKGSIQLNIEENAKGKIEFKVIDTGLGIEPEIINKIFNRFYQNDHKGTSNNIGTGIGLHLTKMLANLHHGEIYVTSKVNEGSCLCVEIPFKQNDFSPEEINEREYSTNLDQSSIEINSLRHVEISATKSDKRNKPRILIVEDSNEIRDLLRAELSNDYIILEAENGKVGYKMACQEKLDIIISDIIMPEMNGIEMVSKIRNNTLTREIPIIILSAKTTEEDHINSISEGVDVYINKPFNMEYLKVNIKNLINKYNILKSQYSKTPKVETTDIDLKDTNDFLIERVNSIIKTRISDPTLNIETLSSEYGISRIHLHRKLKEICHQTPSEYLRNIRLEYAANLLKEKNVPISQIAYAVGFNSHQYFANRFKEKYGISPYEYVEKNKINKIES